MKLTSLLEFLYANFEALEADDVLSLINYSLRICDSALQHGPPEAHKAIKNRKAAILFVLSDVNARIGKMEAAYAAIQLSIKYYQETGRQRGLAKSYVNLANLLGRERDFVRAVDYQLKAMRIFEVLKDTVTLVAVNNNLAINYAQAGNHELAKKYALQALKLTEIKDDKEGVVESLSLLGGIYFRCDEFALALDNHKKALKLSKEINYEFMQGNILADIGNVYADTRQLDSALFYYNAARAIFSKFGDGWALTNTMYNIGNVHKLLKHYELAKKYLLTTIDSLEKYKDDSVLELVYDDLVACDSALGLKDNAIRYSRMAKVLGKKNSSYETRVQLDELQHKYELEKKNRENQQLTDKAKIQQLEINRGKLIVTILTIVFIFCCIIFILIYRDQKARTARRAIELEHRLLRSQMNPHFIFNSFQAIQNFARKNDTEKLLSYLDSFADLTREVLENSRVELIPLSREIVLLKNYLAVQKLRFDERFEYDIHIAQDIPAHSIYLPPMLSQPFIENAVEHGFSDVEEGGRLDIFFSVKDRYLLMDIVDNGVGLQEVNTNEQKHTSLAIAITRERIALLNKKNSQKSLFTIAEADPSSLTRKGVRVSFKLPLSLHH